MDDIQDYWIAQGQLGPMDLFISKNQSLTLGLIMHTIGNDTKIINKIREGYQKGLFELALHGWDHVDYSKMTKQEQQYSLQKANEKMKNLFGSSSKIFIPPMDSFNNDTMNIMSRLGIPIVSSKLYMENLFNHNRSVFVADGNPDTVSSLNKPVHIPGVITFKKYLNGTWLKTPQKEMLGNILDSIERYGYAVIILHPQEFVKVGQSGRFVNVLNESEIKELSSLMDLVSSKEAHITSFSGLTKYRR
jgi:peptidoglycan/xylan/chitin deacetylase (PgdA/CDA1 family)